MNAARPRAGRRGFTLIEVVAVVAVLALLAAAVIPLLLMQMDEMARQKEEVTMRSLNEGLRRYVLRTRTIPSATPGPPVARWS